MSEYSFNPQMARRITAGLTAAGLLLSINACAAPDYERSAQPNSTGASTEATPIDGEVCGNGEPAEARQLIREQLTAAGTVDPYAGSTEQNIVSQLPSLTETTKSVLLTKPQTPIATVLEQVDNKSYNIAPGASVEDLYRSLIDSGNYVDLGKALNKKPSLIYCLPDDLVVVAYDASSKDIGNLMISESLSGNALQETTQLLSGGEEQAVKKQNTVDIVDEEGKGIAYVLAPKPEGTVATPSASPTVAPSPTTTTEAAPDAQKTWLARVNKALKDLDDEKEGFIIRRYITAKDNGDEKTLVINLDIDNTALQTYYDEGKAVERVLAIAKYAQAMGIKVVFNTGRSVKKYDATMAELRKAGYKPDGLCMRKPGQTLVEGKQACRRAQVQKGRTIILNIGNNTTDFEGYKYEKAIELPSQHMGVKLG